MKQAVVRDAWDMGHEGVKRSCLFSSEMTGNSASTYIFNIFQTKQKDAEDVILSAKLYLAHNPFTGSLHHILAMAHMSFNRQRYL